MIDFAKISIIDIDKDWLLKSPWLDFKSELTEKTGELSTKQVAIYHYCKITVYDSGMILFTGSIHKLWNSLNNVLAPNYEEFKIYKGFNGNLFTINNIVEVREHLSKLFNCNPNQMIFQNIEFGINTSITFSPQLFIKGLLYHNGKPFEYRYNEHFAQAIHQRYFLKIYNKSKQYQMDSNTLRIELKVVKTQDIKHLGMTTFEDVDAYKLNKATQLLLKRFNEVVYYDYTIELDKLSERQKQTLTRYSNPRYWINDLKPRKRDTPKKKLKDFIIKYSDNLHLQIRKDIIQKCKVINYTNNQTNGVIINRLSENDSRVIINSSNIGLNITLVNDG